MQSPLRLSLTTYRSNCHSKWQALHSRVWVGTSLCYSIQHAENTPEPWSQFPWTHGRIKMTVLCPTWARTYQTCLRFSPEQLPEAFRWPKPEKMLTMPNCWTTRMTGIDSPRHVTVGFERQVDGSDLAGWGIAAVSPDTFCSALLWTCGVWCAPSRVFFRSHIVHWQHRGTGLAEVLRWIRFFLPRGERVRFFCAKHAAPVTFGVTHARRNVAIARKCSELLLRLK